MPKRQQRPDGRATGENEPSGNQESERCRRSQAATQIIGDFEATDQRQDVRCAAARCTWNARQEPSCNLPVAAHPAVLTRRVSRIRRWVTVEQFDIGEECRARITSLDQVVAEERILRKTVMQRRPHCNRVVDAFSGENPLAEQVHVDIGDCGGVGIDTDIPR